jgi:cytochrome c biogenesis protein CcdA
MESYAVAIASACWLGILTSISPCPLATNITAITFIGKRVGRPEYVLLTGLLYTIGRTITYVVLGALIVASTLAVSDISFFLQEHINKILGPILIVVGLILLGVFGMNISGPRYGKKLQDRVEKYGLWGAGLLGFLFALSFCPVSAALFFGSLIPIAIEQESSILMPTVYGIGTALPVVVFALLIAVSTRLVGSIFNKLTRIEFWARRITGVIFILVGIYYCLTYIFGLNLW